MRRSPLHWRREDGLTLVEMLAALALSGILLILVSTILTTSIYAFNTINDETRLRNEAAIVSAALNARLSETTSIPAVNGSDLILDGKVLNSPEYSLEHTTIEKKGSYLQIMLRIQKKNSSVEPIIMSVIKNL